VRLEASTKSPIHNLIHEFLIIMAFTMACPNFKKGLKMAFGRLGVNVKFVVFYFCKNDLVSPIFLSIAIVIL
jgi:hypothetical protein